MVQLLRQRFYDDSHFTKTKQPQRNAPDWACKRSSPLNFPNSLNAPNAPNAPDGDAPNISVNLRPGGDYDVSIGYSAREKHRRRELSTTGIIRDAIQEADRCQQEDDIPQYYTDEEDVSYSD